MSTPTTPNEAIERAQGALNELRVALVALAEKYPDGQFVGFAAFPQQGSLGVANEPPIPLPDFVIMASTAVANRCEQAKAAAAAARAEASGRRIISPS